MAIPRSTSSRRLEDRIRELCARALHLEEPELTATIRELQTTIHEYLLRLSNIDIATNMRPDLLLDRRHR